MAATTAGCSLSNVWLSIEAGAKFEATQWALEPSREAPGYHRIILKVTAGE
jgi:hypothetical protein